MRLIVDRRAPFCGRWCGKSWCRRSSSNSASPATRCRSPRTVGCSHVSFIASAATVGVEASGRQPVLGGVERLVERRFLDRSTGAQQPHRVGVLLIAAHQVAGDRMSVRGGAHPGRSPDPEPPIGALHEVDEIAARDRDESRRDDVEGGGHERLRVARGRAAPVRAAVARGRWMCVTTPGAARVPPAPDHLSTPPTAPRSGVSPSGVRIIVPAGRHWSVSPTTRDVAGGRRRGGGRSRSAPGWCPGTRRRGCARSAPVRLEHVGVVAQQADGVDEQVVEVHRPGLVAAAPGTPGTRRRACGRTCSRPRPPPHRGRRARSSTG